MIQTKKQTTLHPWRIYPSLFMMLCVCDPPPPSSLQPNIALMLFPSPLALYPSRNYGLATRQHPTFMRDHAGTGIDSNGLFFTMDMYLSTVLRQIW
jgi:hypothetical protein